MIKKIVALVAIFSSFMYGNNAYDSVPCPVTKNGVLIRQDSPECLELIAKHYERLPKANIPSDEPKQTLDEQIEVLKSMEKANEDYNKKMKENFKDPFKGLENIKKIK